MDMKAKNKKEILSVSNAQHLSNGKLNSVNEENHFYENIVNTVREPLLILDKDLRVVKANQSFFDFFPRMSNNYGLLQRFNCEVFKIGFIKINAFP